MSSCSIKVICRFRPMNAREKTENVAADFSLKYIEDHTTELSLGKQHHTFTFDRVFDSDTEQEIVYNFAAKPCIQDVLEGYNGTIFAYGQSGSGKTFTMFGPEKPYPEELKGVVPRASSHIFDYIENDEKTSYAIKCSFLEIYKENIRDLLTPNSKDVYLKIRESPTKGVWVDGLTEEDIDDLIALGDNARSVSFTSLNARSSRSHSIFIVAIEQKAEDGSTKTGKLNLIDLAGSEKIGKTGAKGETLEEAKKINQSLSALGKCINALTTNKGHIPYRESKLTRILQESLGGNTKTTLIVTCSPHAFNAEETISTMAFGQRAKTIKNKVQINKQLSIAELEASLKKLQKEYSSCKTYSTKLEKQIAWMKSADYDPSSPLPADLVATPVTISTVTQEEEEDTDSTLQSELAVEDDEDGDAIAIAETKLELEKLRDELDMEASMLKDELMALQARAEDKRQMIKDIADETARACQRLEETRTVIVNQRTQHCAEIEKITTEKKEKEDEISELQQTFQHLSEDTAKLQAALSETDENLLVLFADNEVIRTELATLGKQYQSIVQSVADLTRQEALLKQKAESSKLEVVMLSEGGKELEQELATLEAKQREIGNEYASFTRTQTESAAQLSKGRGKISELNGQVEQYGSLIELLRETMRTLEGKLKDQNSEYCNIVERGRSSVCPLLSAEGIITALLYPSSNASSLKAELDSCVAKTGPQESLFKAREEVLAAVQKELQQLREYILTTEQSLLSARNDNKQFHQQIVQLRAETDVVSLEKQQMQRSRDMQNIRSHNSSNFLETLNMKLKRILVEKESMEKELKSFQESEASLASVEADWKKKLQGLEGTLRQKEQESARLQTSLTKESARLTSNAAVVATQTSTIKTQKERLAELKVAVGNARAVHTNLKKETEALGQHKEELERDLVEKEQQRQEAQRSALEASRLREQMINRRRVVNRTPTKKGLLEAFQQKVDIEAQKSGLRTTGSLFLKEARDEHMRSIHQPDDPKSKDFEPKATSGNKSSSPKVTPKASKRQLPPQLLRRQSVLQDLITKQPSMLDVRVSGVRLTAAELSLYEQMFSHYDKDKSGTIDSNELRALLSELGRNISDEDMSLLMKELDRDGNGLIEFSEFLQGMDRLNQINNK